MAKDPADDFSFLRNKEWKTPNTYDSNYGTPPTKAGVYIIVRPIMELSRIVHYEVLYVGSASNIKQRYDRHEVRRILNIVYGYIQFYFKVVENYKKEEIALIKKYHPKFNQQWR